MIDNISFHQFIVFFIAMTRIATITFTVPFFGFEAVPGQLKFGLAFLITLILFPFLEKVQTTIPQDMLPFIFMLLGEVLIGLVIGFASAILFVGIRYAGTLIGLEMGFGIVNVIDPQSGEQVSIIGQLKYLLALLLFLAMNGHHFLLELIQLSFQAVPAAGGIFQTDAVRQIMNLSSDIFVVAIKIASTTFTALFLTSVVMAVVARLVPQMNVFIVGFPLKISVGFIMMFLSLPFFMYAFGKMFMLFQKDVIGLVALLR